MDKKREMLFPNDYYKYLTKFEKARIISARALQIAMGAPILIKIDKETLEKIRYDPIEIAKMEFEQGVIPIVVLRRRANR